jgi:hypothetical protein
VSQILANKVLSLACLQSTGAIKSAPTIALKAMLDLPPLPDLVKKEEAKSALWTRLTQIKYWRYTGTFEVLQGFPKCYGPVSIGRQKAKKVRFDAQFQVIIHDR